MELTVSTELKKKLLASFLVVLFLWPAVQHTLVVRYHLNPWWLFGMAMYCDLHRVQDFSVGQLVGNRVERIPMEALTEEIHQEVDRYRRNAIALGALADFQTVSDRILEHLPNADGIVYSSTRVGIDRSTARIVHHRDVRIARRRAEPQ